MEITGMVIKLGSQDPNQGGEVIVRASWEGERKLRPIRVVLLPENYQQAILAHSERWMVRCVGEIAREGSSWTLRNARSFSFDRSDENDT